MAKILSFHPNRKIEKENIFKSLFEEFKSLDKFTKLVILTLLLIILATPFIIHQYQIFTGRGQIGVTVGMTVDTTVVINPFDAKMRGSGLVTWMHSALEKPGPNEAANLAEVTKPLKPGIVRFAGGLFVNRTGWDRSNTIQERWDFRPPWQWKDPDTGIVFPYDYHHVYNAAMIDSLSKFASATGAEVMVEINVCDNNPKMWADLVKYANVEHSYKFKYWELGNELSLDWSCLGSATESDAAKEYANRFIAYRTALQAIDPTIQLMGPVAHQPSHNSTWMPPLLDVAVASGKILDVASWHRYPMWNTPITWTMVQDNLLSITARKAMIEDAMTEVHNLLSTHGSSGTKTAISELNTHVANSISTNSNHIGALWMLDVLPRLAYNGLNMNTWYNLYDGGDYFEMIYPDNDVTPTKLSIRPTYYGMLMLSQYFGDTLIKSSTTDPEEKVVVWASTDTKDPGKLKLMLVNLTGASASVQITLTGFTPKSGVYYEMTNPDPANITLASSGVGTTINGFTVDTTAGKVQSSINAITSKTVTGISGNTITHTIPAYSAVAMTLSSDSTTPTLTPTPIPALAPAASYTTSAIVSPSTVTKGNNANITASVTLASAASVVVDVEIYDPSDKYLFQQYFENETFSAGQTKNYPVTWTIPSTATRGVYVVKIGIFTLGWTKLLNWNNNAGNFIVTFSPILTPVVRDTTPPTVSITSPLNNSTVSRNTTITITATASDTIGVTKVDFLVSGSLKCTDSISPYTCLWKVPTSKGRTYTLTARAYDSSSNTAASTISVTGK